MSKKKENVEENENIKETEKENEKEAVKEEPAKDKKNDTDYEKLISEKDEALKVKTEQYQRLLAEYDNFKKRTVREKEAIYTDSVKDTVAVLLPVIDNLERALDAFDNKEGDQYKGVEMILKQTEEAFKKLGVSKIESVGETFNPELHNAVMHIEDDSVTENTVVEEFQKGYTYKDKVIRHSMVKVAN